MEVHSPAVGKKLWNYIKVAFFMVRKGLLSKRKLIMDLNLMMKRGKLLGKSLGKNLVFSRTAPPHGFGFGLQDYEFSCSNTPRLPVFPHGSTSKRRHNYFSCISTSSADDDDDEPGPVVVTPRIEYSPQYCSSSYLSYDLAPGEKLSPLPSPAPFSVRLSNFSSEDEDEAAGRSKVDDEAEEFIRMFYEQLRAQSRIGLLEYQEREYREMLARAT